MRWTFDNTRGQGDQHLHNKEKYRLTQPHPGKRQSAFHRHHTAPQQRRTALPISSRSAS